MSKYPHAHRHAVSLANLTPRLTLLSFGLLLAMPAMAQETPPPTQEAVQLDTVQVLGSRAKGRTAAETAAPVDVINREQLERTGAQEIGQILQMLEPSFNFSRTTISDGTDILRPATLRSLGPDQVLVLVNGKRRHQQALVNVQQTSPAARRAPTSTRFPFRPSSVSKCCAMARRRNTGRMRSLA